MAAHPRDTANRLLGTEEVTIRMVEMRSVCRSPAVMVVEILMVPLATDAILPGTTRVLMSDQVVVAPSIIAVGGKKPRDMVVRGVIKAERKAVDMAASKNTAEAAMVKRKLLELRGSTLMTGKAKSAVITTNTKTFSACVRIFTCMCRNVIDELDTCNEILDVF
jgi:hypothetical protein